ncbi:MAG: DnaD domain-containing protein [Saccharofermentanales bacterium]
MQIDESKKLLFSDTLVPDIFITEYLPVLGGLAIKIYIYSHLLIRTRKIITENELAAKMGTDYETVKAALIELATHDLVSLTEKGFTINDIKSQEIEKIYKLRTSQDPTGLLSESTVSEREKMMSDINKTFFFGIMSPSWYCEIDNWFDKYRFDPQVVYALFNECKRRKKLDSKAYISKVAQNWSEHGIVSYQDLNEYFLSYDKINKIFKKVGQKLHKNITEYDEELISKWVEKMGMEFEIIDIALRKTSKLANPNLEFTNKVLEEWFSNQLKTIPEIMEFEEKKAKKYFASQKGDTNPAKTGDRKPGNVANFQQREYSAEYFEQMIEDVTKY